MELDERALTSEEYHKRFLAYLDVGVYYDWMKRALLAGPSSSALSFGCCLLEDICRINWSLNTMPESQEENPRNRVTFFVSEDCMRLGLRPAVIVFRGLRIGESPRELRQEMAEEVKRIRERFTTSAVLRSTPAIATLHAIFRSVGVNPRRVQPACERLAQFAMKRGDLPKINNLVDAYNLISIRSLCSLGAHDLDTLSLPVSLSLLRGNETFTALGRENAEPITSGEFAYVDSENRIICRLDVAQCEFSKVTACTANALVIVGATSAHPSGTLRAIMQDSLQTIGRYCGGEPEIVHLPR